LSYSDIATNLEEILSVYMINRVQLFVDVLIAMKKKKDMFTNVVYAM